MKQLLAWLGVLLLGAVAQVHADEPSPQQWLQRMLQAANQVSYQGVIVLGAGEHWDSYTVRHATFDNQEYEYVFQLSAAPQEFVRHGQQLFCGHPEPIDHHHNPLKNPLRPQTALLAENLPYRFQLGGVQRIAGRMAQQLLVIPLDTLRYGVSLWLDQQTGLLLGSDLVQGQHILERAQFAQIDIGLPLTPADFTPRFAGHAFVAVPTTLLPSSVPIWQPRWLPDGFTLAYAQETESSSRLMYFDGVTVFSVFIDSAEPPIRTLERQWGATAAVVVQVEIGGQRRRITAVGEVPLLTLKQVALSTQPETTSESQNESGMGDHHTN